jgi:TPR repeat protein
MSGVDTSPTDSDAVTAEYPAANPELLNAKSHAAVEPFVALRYERLGELAQTRSGSTIYLTRERATGRLVGLELDTTRARDPGDAADRALHVTFTIEPSDLEANHCLTCGRIAGAVARLCAVCGSPIAVRATELGHSRAELLEAVRQQAVRYDVLGDVDLGAEEGIVYLARHRSSERLMALRLERDRDDDSFVLDTVPLSRVAALLVDDRAPGADESAPAIPTEEPDVKPKAEPAVHQATVMTAHPIDHGTVEPNAQSAMNTPVEATASSLGPTATEITICEFRLLHEPSTTPPMGHGASVRAARAARATHALTTRLRPLHEWSRRIGHRSAIHVAALMRRIQTSVRDTFRPTTVAHARSLAIGSATGVVLWLGYLNGRTAQANVNAHGKTVAAQQPSPLPSAASTSRHSPTPTITTGLAHDAATADTSRGDARLDSTASETTEPVRAAGSSAKAANDAAKSNSDLESPRSVANVSKSSPTRESEANVAKQSETETETLSCADAYDAKKWTTAAESCRSEATSGSSDAQLHWGLLLAAGNGTRKDVTSAVSWLTRAAEGGSAEAAYQLARASRTDIGKAPNDERVLELLTRAARSGHIGAQRELGMHYAEGRSTSKDRAAAMTWFETAANAGDAESQYRVAWLLETASRPSAHDDTTAVQWLTRAAEQGHLQAQYYLGFMSAQGRGMQRSDSVATAWWKKAAARGHEDARRVLSDRDR